MRKVDYHGYTIFEDGRIIGLYGKEVKKRINNGRYEIRLVIDGKRKNYIVARLMYFVFVGFDISNKDLCITHKDGDYLNVHINNLQLQHRRDLIQGDKHVNRAKLTNEQVEEIRRLYRGKTGNNQYDKQGYSLQDLANMYGVSKANIRMIISGDSRNKKDYKLK
ncbi:hypothetical protein [Siminovitchia sp. 179-K 8D1 HS]|uniref:hypothetical protein n=1 Tax=Siminovitchia sp. 179-K 8D1 HS TaxID=3142385 RepID=UPI0039A077A7